MAKSVRISDALFEHATLESTLMHRSIAMQIEHWCALGKALAASGMSVDELKRTLQGQHMKVSSAKARAPVPTSRAPLPERTAPEARLWAEKRQRQRRDRAAIASGKVTSESMYLIPPRLARITTGRFKDVKFDD